MTNMKYCICSILLAMCQQGHCGNTQHINQITTTDEITHVINTFQWFNQQVTENRDARIKLTLEDVGRYFSENAVMITNGKIVCQGLEEHYQHFVEFQQKFKSMQTAMPFKVIESNNNKVWLHYTIDTVDNTGKKDAILVMGYMQLAQGKIDRFEELIVHI